MIPIAWRDLFRSRRSDQPQVQVKKQRPHRTRNRHGVNRRASVAEADGKGTSGKKLSTRLGKSDLGRFAHEKEMPQWLVNLLQREGEVCGDDVLPVLKKLLEQSASTRYAYLCHPRVQHVSKLKGEGGFCGYRNIQMLISHLIASGAPGSERFGSRFPTIFQIQDLIEDAWDLGFNAHGRAETGGIKGTRKYIGTPEAQALFCSLDVPCSVQAIKDDNSAQAGARLMQAVENYFRAGYNEGEGSKVRFTELAPIYLQRRGHSMTIVGIERLASGQVQLLVFDPSFRDPGTVRRLVGKPFRHKASAADHTLSPYRRGKKYLRSYSEFELL